MMEHNPFGVVHKSFGPGFEGYVLPTDLTPQQRKQQITALRNMREARQQGKTIPVSIHGINANKPTALTDYAVMYNEKAQTALRRRREKKKTSPPKRAPIRVNEAQKGKVVRLHDPGKLEAILRTPVRPGQQAKTTPAPTPRGQGVRFHASQYSPMPSRYQPGYSGPKSVRNAFRMSGKSKKAIGVTALAALGGGGIFLRNQRKTDRKGVYRWNG